MSTSCTLKRLHTLANGKEKVYHYSSIRGTPISEYHKENYKYKAHPKIPKYQTLPQIIKDEIMRFHEHGIGVIRITALIGCDPRFQHIKVGKHSIVQLIKASHSVQK
jgi:hypothetical protein